MGLVDISKSAVESAIEEHDRLGRDEFLRKYGFQHARNYILVHDGREYDSKAMLGAAHGFLDGRSPLTWKDFSGGASTVAKRLSALGFAVKRGLGKGPGATSGPIPFRVGQLYNRRSDIHAVFSGQQQGGIVTPGSAPFIFLFTGESGEQHGYSDGWRADGVFSYTGEGQRGDMQFVRGNRAIKDHAIDGKDLLLFEASATRSMYRYRGGFDCVGWELGTGPDTDGNLRSTIVFLLAPAVAAEAEEPP